jgi:hypothetical protein
VRRYTLEAPLAGLPGAFRACSVAVGGRRLERSAWSQERGVLTATFSMRHAAVVVNGC